MAPNHAFPASFEQFVAERIASGRYQSTEEVLTAAQQALLREEADDDAKLAALDKALVEGRESGIFEGDPFKSVWKEMGWEGEP